MCEPYISPLSYPVYKFLHEEPLDLSRRSAGARRRARRRRAIRSTRTRRFRRCCSGAGGGAFARGVPGAGASRASSTCRASATRPRAASRAGRSCPGRCGRCCTGSTARCRRALMRWMAFRMLVVARTGVARYAAPVFIGHFAVGFASKRAAPRASLGVLMAAPLFLDLLWPIFLIAGIESVRIEPGQHRVHCRWTCTTIPWSHSLVTSLAWSAVFAAAVLGGDALRARGAGARRWACSATGCWTS